MGSDVERIFDAIMQADMDMASRMVVACTEGQSYTDIVTKVLQPLLDIISKDADAQEVSLAQGYVTSKVVERALECCHASPGAPEQGECAMRSVVVGNVEDDCHPLGIRIVGSFLKGAGWDVHDLGIDVPADMFVEEAIRLQARVIGVSAMTYSTAENVRTLRDEIDRRGLTGRLLIAAGGAAFRLRPELLMSVGADGTAEDARRAPVLFDELWERASEALGGEA